MKKRIYKRMLVGTATCLLLLSPVSFSAQALAVESDNVGVQQLLNLSVLEYTELFSNNGNSYQDGVRLTKNQQGKYDINLSFTGTGVSRVGLADSKVIVFAIPEELQGKLTDDMTVSIDAAISPIVPANVPGVKGALDTVGLAITALATSTAAVGQDLSALQNAYQSLYSLKDMGTYHNEVPAHLSTDGKSIVVDHTEGIGQYVRNTYGSFFNPLQQAVNNLKFTGLIGNTLNPLLDAVKAAVNALFLIVNPIVNGTSNNLSQALNANLLGNTKYILKATANEPEVPQARISAAAVSTTAVDVNVLNQVINEGDNVELYFNLLAGFVLPYPQVDVIYHDADKITGSITLPKIPPANTILNVNVYLPNGQVLTGPLNVVGTIGNFNIPLGDNVLQADDKVDVEVVAQNETDQAISPRSRITVEENNPLRDYLVPTPTVDSLLIGGVAITGSFDTTNLPENSTVKILVYKEDDTFLETTIDANGHFIISYIGTGTLGNVNFRVLARVFNSGFQKDSDVTMVTVQSFNPLKTYTIPSPVIGTVKAGVQQITGMLNISNAPLGTTFQVNFRFSDGQNKTVSVDSQTGTFILNTSGILLKAGDSFRVRTIAKNGVYTANSIVDLITVSR